MRKKSGFLLVLFVLLCVLPLFACNGEIQDPDISDKPDITNPGDDNPGDNDKVPAALTYTITWKNYDGTTLETDLNVSQGTTPEYNGATPSKLSTAQYNYAFNAWSPAVVPATADATYTATFIESAKGSFHLPDALTKALLMEMLDDLFEMPTILGNFPDTLKGDYAANQINQNAAAFDFASGFVNVSAIPQKGHGEQWDMIYTNLKESQNIITAANFLGGLSSGIVLAYEAFLDGDNIDNASFASWTTASENSNVTIAYANHKFSLLVENGIVQYYTFKNMQTYYRETRIEATTANAVKIETNADGDIKIAVKYLGIRQALFTMTATNEGFEGNITEYLGVSPAQIKATAQFYLNGSTLTVVGNKADGMLGWDGTICEVYSVATGKLLGYEVRETLLTITYNCLWFSASDISGWTSVKMQLDNGTPTNASDCIVYVNGNSSAEFEPRTVGGISLKTASRRFDIEFRKQYFYYKDDSDKLQKVCIEVPMLFVQEEYLDTLAVDITNKNTSLTWDLTSAAATNSSFIRGEYAKKLPVFDTYKSTAPTSEAIITYIGNRFA